MNRYTKLLSALLLGVAVLSACSSAKLEARLEANPQCKDIVNPKTGALMPCPGTDKSFYRSVGLEVPKPTSVATTSALIPAASSSPSSSASVKAETVAAGTTTKSLATPATDCKPQLHKKTGGMLPCPAPEY